MTPWSNGSALSKPIKEAIEAESQEAVGDALWSTAIAPAPFIDALMRAGQARLQTFSEGVQTYQNHPHRRAVDPPKVWPGPQALPILDYGGPDDGVPVLVVPSLVNKAYVLDLFADRSFMRALAHMGLRTYMLDWTASGAAEPDADLTTYIDQLLVPALSILKELHGRPTALAGYCMGGTLAVAPAALHPGLVSMLILLAAPWDFHAGSEGIRHWLTLCRTGLETTLESLGQAPVDLLQSLFAGLDPTLVGRKFRSFAAMDPDSDAAKRFVVLEDWLNDGVPLAGPVARECLFGWYQDNTPMKEQWRVGGAAVDPGQIQCPVLAVIPERDRIVPPASAHALADRVPGADVQSVALGHIGMMTSGRAAQEVYEPVAGWIKNAASQ